MLILFFVYIILKTKNILQTNIIFKPRRSRFEL